MGALNDAGYHLSFIVGYKAEDAAAFLECLGIRRDMIPPNCVPYASRFPASPIRRNS
jgi:hypothetical protein